MSDTLIEVKESLIEGFDKIASAYGIADENVDMAKESLSETFDELVKEANLGARFMAGAGKATGFGGSMGSRVAAGVGAGLVGVGSVLAADAIKGLASIAVNKVGKSFGASSDRAAYEKAFAESMASSELLQNDPLKAKRMADTIFSFAPTIAGDSNVLTNILNNTIHGDSMDLQTVRAVTELEEKLKKMKG